MAAPTNPAIATMPPSRIDVAPLGETLLFVGLALVWLAIAAGMVADV